MGKIRTKNHQQPWVRERRISAQSKPKTSYLGLFVAIKYLRDKLYVILPLLCVFSWVEMIVLLPFESSTCFTVLWMFSDDAIYLSSAALTGLVRQST